MPESYRETMKESVLDEATFVRLTLKGKQPKQEVPYRRIVVRPVLIKGERHLQFSYFTEKQDVTKNYRDTPAEEKLDEALALPYSLLQLETTQENLEVQITKGGKPIFHRTKQAEDKRLPDLSHDHSKAIPLPAGKPDAFLQRLGIMDQQGRVLPSMQDKFSQINEFLKLMEHTGELQKLTSPVNILDCGSGSSYLSFAVYHYLNNVLGIPSTLTGIDVNEDLIEKSNAQGAELGYSDICFRRSAIIDYKPDPKPDIILALHACDTATDEAIAQGILNDALLILCVPCCHHDLHEQIRTISPFKPVLQQGILKKRLADILTDTFRTLALRIMGYKADVVEFVSSEHTDRNLMIRAVKSTRQGSVEALREYNALKEFWGVVPYVEKLLPPFENNNR